MGLFDKGSTTTTNTSQATPYAPAQPAIQSELNGVNSYLKDPSSFKAYTGQRVAQITPTTQSGIDQLAQGRGAQQSMDYLGNVIGGSYLNQGNPYQDALDKSIIAGVSPSINNAFSAAGLTGSTLNQTALTQGLTSALAAPHYQNYQNERGLQQQAAELLPQVEDLSGKDKILAGQTGEQYTQANLDAAKQQFYEQQQAKIQPYINASPLINSAAQLGGTQTGTQTQTKTAPIGQQLLGGALLGGSLLAGPMSLAGASTLGGGLLNMAAGAPSDYGSSWSPWTQRGFGQGAIF